MNELQVFKNSEFGELGVLQIDGKEYFPATACAKALEYAKPHNAIKQHCRYSLKKGVPHPQNKNKEITMTFIPIGDLIRLITHSKMKKAQQYECWVFDEVLPSIHKNGGYFNNPFTFMESVAEGKFSGLTKEDASIDFSEIITQVVAQTVAEIMKQLIPAIVTVVKETIKETIREIMPQNTTALQFAPPVDFYSSTRCKLETFPPSITEQVDTMLEDMQRQQALNFSMISRFCTINGYSISSPAVKKYFDKKFQIA